MKKHLFKGAVLAVMLAAAALAGLLVLPASCDSTPTGRPPVGSREYEARRRAAENRLANAQAELDAIVGAEISEAEAAAWKAEAEAYFAALEAGKTVEEADAEAERAAVAAVVATGQTQTQAAATVSQQRQRQERAAELEAEVREAETELAAVADLIANPQPPAAPSATAAPPVVIPGADPIEMVLLNNGRGQSFYIGKYKITKGQFEAMGLKGGSLYSPDHLTYPYTLAFCNMLSRMEGLRPAYKETVFGDGSGWFIDAGGINVGDNAEMVPGSNGYRLLNNAQWDFAYRAGRTGNDLNDSRDGVPNPWGLYEMDQEYEYIYAGVIRARRFTAMNNRLARLTRSGLRRDEAEYPNDFARFRIMRPVENTVAVSRPAGFVTKGKTLDFTAIVAAPGSSPSQAVIWSIEQAGKNRGTTIDSNGRLTVAAGETLASLTVRAASAADPSQWDTASINIVNPIKPMEMARINPGTFRMGQNRFLSWEPDHSLYEHQVTLTQGFWMGKYEVTQEQWLSVMGSVRGAQGPKRKGIIIR